MRARHQSKDVRRMREAARGEVHFRLASPPILYPDYYGIDLPDAAAFRPTLRWRRCATHRRGLVAFLSIDGMYRAMANPAAITPIQIAGSLFYGAYPTH